MDDCDLFWIQAKLHNLSLCTLADGHKGIGIAQDNVKQPLEERIPLGFQDVTPICPNEVGNTKGLFEVQGDQSKGQGLSTLDPIECLLVIESQSVKERQNQLQESFNDRGLPQKPAPATDREGLLGIKLPPSSRLGG
jgi:hypothetical protein